MLLVGQGRQHGRQPLAEVVVARPDDVGDAEQADEDRAERQDPQHDRDRRRRLVRRAVAVIVVAAVRVVAGVRRVRVVAVRLGAFAGAAVLALEDEEVEAEHVERGAAGRE